MSDKKRRFISTLVTVTVHLLVLLLLMFITLRLADKSEVEDGVPVLLGEVEDAEGADMGGLPNDMGEVTDDADADEDTEAETEETEDIPQVTAPTAKELAAER
ncbi:MAG: hypothetical protein MJY90_04175, partial [Bacteroidaceae bacterium]|nr:hypothetical protein [Bacteroidaceae bacterium]